MAITVGREILYHLLPRSNSDLWPVKTNEEPHGGGREYPHGGQPQAVRRDTRGIAIPRFTVETMTQIFQSLIRPRKSAGSMTEKIPWRMKPPLPDWVGAGL